MGFLGHMAYNNLMKLPIKMLDANMNRLSAGVSFDYVQRHIIECF